jgi:hypothetical protein
MRAGAGILLLAAALLAGGCSSMENDRAALDARRRLIVASVRNAGCDGNAECRFVGLTPKACGSYYHWLVYPSTMDTANLLRVVSQYNDDEDRFSREWGVASDCSIEPSPGSMGCFQGNCVGYWGGVPKIVGP